MNDDLTQMVNSETDDEPMAFSKDELDLPEEKAAEEEVVAGPVGGEEQANDGEAPEEATQTETNQANDSISVVSLGSWFEQNGSNFQDIRQVKLQVNGVDPKEDLVLTIPHESGAVLEGDIPKRRLIKIDDANVIPVLDLPGIDMKVYNNGFRIINQYNDTTYLKCYGVKTGLIVVFCAAVHGHLLPFLKTKVGKKAADLEVQFPEINLAEKATQNLDKENLILLYRQATGDTDDLVTNLDAVRYLSEKQDSIRDINHHIQIDNALIEILKR